MDLEETLLEKRVEFKEISSKVSGMLEKAPEMFRSAYEQLKGEEAKYVQMARDLEVPFSLRVPKDECDINLDQIDENITSMKAKVAELMEHSDFETPNQAMESATKMQGYGANARGVQDSQNELFNMVKDYSDEAMFEIQKGVDERVQEVIKSIKLQLLAIKRQDLQDRRISFFGRLMGAERLKELELANLGLEESILKNTPVIAKTAYNIQDTLADLRAFVMKDLNDQNTIETKAILYSSLEVFGLSEAVIDEKATRKLYSVPMVIADKKRRVKTSEKIEKAKQRNQYLEGELMLTNSKAAKAKLDVEAPKETVAERFARVLRETVVRTSPEQVQVERAKAQERQAMKDNQSDKEQLGEINDDAGNVQTDKADKTKDLSHRESHELDVK